MAVSVVGAALVPAASAAPTDKFDINTAVQDIQTKVTDIQTKVTSIQTTITTLNTQLTNWFGPSGEYKNVEKTISKSGYLDTAVNPDAHLKVHSPDPNSAFKVTLTFGAMDLESNEHLNVRYQGVDTYPPYLGGSIFQISDNDAHTYEFACTDFSMYQTVVGDPGASDGMRVWYSCVITYSGAAPTVSTGPVIPPNPTLNP